ncbi:MAG TPA: hypothetical protein VFY79_10645 [Dehalococcoidia bacterium]|nr:hypothetical protein [Dehalococcoidia bacterium]
MKRRGTNVTVRAVCAACASGRLRPPKEPCGRAPCVLAPLYMRTK